MSFALLDRPLTPGIRDAILTLAQGQDHLTTQQAARALGVNPSVATGHLQALVRAGELTVTVLNGRRSYRLSAPDLDPALVDEALMPTLLSALSGRVDTARHLARHLRLPREVVEHTLARLHADERLPRTFVGALPLYGPARPPAALSPALARVLVALDPMLPRGVTALAYALHRPTLGKAERAALEEAVLSSLAVLTPQGYVLTSAGAARQPTRPHQEEAAPATRRAS